MKRFLCFLFSVLMLFSAFTVFAGAQEASEPSLMQELSNLQIDGKSFDEIKDTKFPVNTRDENLYVLTMVEKGFRDTANADGFELYLYLYNPSCMVVKDDLRNSAQIAINENRDRMNWYGVKIHSVSEDYRFIKISLNDVPGLFASLSGLCLGQESAEKRIYNVYSVKLLSATGLQTFPMKRVFYFEGSDAQSNLKTCWKDMDVLEVELHTTNWISPNAGLRVDNGTKASIYDHYELHTVYFRVPKSYWDTYGTLYSIQATYDAVHLTPIIVTREDDIDFESEAGEFTKDAILDGITIDEIQEMEWDIYDLVWYNRLSWLDGSDYNSYAFSEKDTLLDIDYVPVFLPGAVGGAWVPHIYKSEHHNALAYYFASLPQDFDYTNGEQIASAAVSQKELSEYFYARYNDPQYDNSLLYSEYLRYQDLSLDGTMFYANGLYTMNSHSSIMDNESNWKRWMMDLMNEDDSPLYETFADSVKHIEVIENPAEWANYPTTELVANELLIHEADVPEFSKLCSDAAEAGDYVVLLRIGFNDYSCTPVRDAWELNVDQGPFVGVAVDKWVYLNMSLAELVFSKDGSMHNVPVVSNTVDSFGNLDVGGDVSNNGPGEFIEEGKNQVVKVSKKIWDVIREDFTRLLIIVGVLAALFVVLLIVFNVLRKKERVAIFTGDPDAGGGGKRKRRKRKK